MVAYAGLRVRGALVVLVALLGGSAASGDVLVTKSGSRYEGTITQEADGYVLVTPGGGRMVFPKSMVQQIIRSAEAKVEFEGMLKQADLADDKEVARLSAFAKDKGLSEQRERLLARAYAVRHAKARGKTDALRALSAWCGEHGLTVEAGACQAEACRLEFPSKFAGARNDASALEELGKWCVSHGLAAEAEQCLSGQYAARSKQADTPRKRWELAEWSQQWKQQRWRDEQRLAAIREAAAAADLSQLLEFLKSLPDDAPDSETRRACGRAIYGLRAKAAGGDPMEMARLSVWCREQDLTDEAKTAEDEALRKDPDDVTVREKLGYAREADTGRWVLGPKVMTAGPWKMKVASVKLADSFEDSGFEGMTVRATKPGTRIAIVEVHCEAMRGYTPEEVRALQIDNLSKLGLELLKTLKVELMLNNEFFFLLSDEKLGQSPAFVCRGGLQRTMSVTSADGSTRRYLAFCAKGKSGTATLAFPVAGSDSRPVLIFSPTWRIEDTKVARISILGGGRFKVRYGNLGNLAKPAWRPQK